MMVGSGSQVGRDVEDLAVLVDLPREFPIMLGS